MATFKSMEDLAVLQKQMKQKKEAKAKQARSEKDDNYAFVYSTTTYNAIDKNVLKKLKESQITKGNNPSLIENSSAGKQDKKARHILIRKLERKGLSKNAIKSQLRPCLTWNDDIKHESESRDRRKNKLHMMSNKERMELPISTITFGRKKKQRFSSTGVPLPSDEAMREYMEKKRHRREKYYKNNSKTDRTPRGKFYINVCMGGQNKKY